MTQTLADKKCGMGKRLVNELHGVWWAGDAWASEVKERRKTIDINVDCAFVCWYLKQSSLAA